MAERLSPEELARIRGLVDDVALHGLDTVRELLDEIEALHMEYEEAAIAHRHVCEMLTAERDAALARNRELIDGYEARVAADHVEIAELQQQVAAAEEARDAAVAREAALTGALRQIRAHELGEALMWESAKPGATTDCPQCEDMQGIAALALADPSPAAKQHMTRVAALERGWRHLKHPTAPGYDAAVDAMYRLDEAGR